MMNAVARRPTPAAQPKPEARAFVGNTSDVKICMALPATWMKNTMTKPATISSIGAPALAKTTAMMAAPMNAQIDVILRPHLSSAYIMKMLAHGTAKFIARVYCSVFVNVHPIPFDLFDRHDPRPDTTPDDAVKHIS